MGHIAADVDGLAAFPQQCVLEPDAVAASGGELTPGSRFQATAAAVTAVHDGVAAARRTLVERMAATSERVTAAAHNYDATEQSSSSSLRVVGDIGASQCSPL
jgi:Excreted virulence factor EspC, type VII ESX diderm